MSTTDALDAPPSATPDGSKKGKSTPSSAQGSAKEKATKPARQIHHVLQGKGGVGKTLVASLIVQFLRENGHTVACLDIDVVNHSLSEIPAMKAEEIEIFIKDRDGADTDELDAKVLDGMLERFATEDTDFVCDNGAASFIPISTYLIDTGVADVLEGVGRKLVIHTIIAGGQELTQTVKGFDSLARHFPPNVDIILWLNEHHGLIRGDDRREFEETPVFQTHKARIRGVVRLHRQHKFFAANFSDFLGRGLTFDEAAKSDQFMIAEKQRLVQIKRSIWEQLQAVL